MAHLIGLSKQQKEVTYIFTPEVNVMSKGENNEDPPKVPSCNWRDPNLTRILHLLDVSYVQPAHKPNIKRQRCEKLESWKPSIAATLEDGFGDVPDNIPKNRVKAEALNQMSEVELLSYNFLPPVDLSPALQTMERLTTLRFLPQ